MLNDVGLRTQIGKNLYDRRTAAGVGVGALRSRPLGANSRHQPSGSR
jgi:hypothetical protein